MLLIILSILLILLIIYLFLILGIKLPKDKSSWIVNTKFAHRGLYSKDQNIPENSIKAFELAIENNYGVEFDVAMTKDNVLVIFHDDNLKRLTGLDKDIWDCTYEELNSLRLAKTNHKIPTFKETLDFIKGDIPLIIEIKNSKNNNKICELVKEELRNYKGLYCIESFNPVIVGWFKKNDPKVIRGQLSMNYKGEKHFSWINKRTLQYMLLNFISRPHFIAYEVQYCNNLSFKVNRAFKVLTVAWTVNTKELLDISNINYDAIIFEHLVP